MFAGRQRGRHAESKSVGIFYVEPRTILATGERVQRRGRHPLPAAISDIVVSETWMDGRPVYER